MLTGILIFLSGVCCFGLGCRLQAEKKALDEKDRLFKTAHNNYSNEINRRIDREKELERVGEELRATQAEVDALRKQFENERRARKFAEEVATEHQDQLDSILTILKRKPNEPA